MAFVSRLSCLLLCSSIFYVIVSACGQNNCSQVPGLTSSAKVVTVTTTVKCSSAGAATTIGTSANLTSTDFLPTFSSLSQLTSKKPGNASTFSVPPISASLTCPSYSLPSAGYSNSSANYSNSTADCQPHFTLEGVSESAFNPAQTAFRLRMACGHLNQTNYTVTANWKPVKQAMACDDTILVPGMPRGYVLLAVYALSTRGEPIMASFELLFGSASLPVCVLDVNGQPAPNVSVQCNSTSYIGVGQVGLTNSQGLVTFSNVSEVTVALTARTADNQISVNGVAGGKTSTITMRLLPFHKPSGNLTLGVGNGTSGWTGGKEVALKSASLQNRNTRGLLWKRDTSLVLSTSAKEGVQTAYSSFVVDENTSSAYIEYRFQTAEVPGGYYGTKFNDYFSITIRTDTGGYVSVVHDMNELGLGAFDATGTTKWNTLQLDTTNAKSVEYTIAVANVADALYDSAITVRRVGGDKCDKCADSCDMCSSRAKCQDSCKDPPINSCNFYRSCLDATTPCGNEGFAIKRGEKTCMKFQHNLDQLSDAAVAWVTKSEHCIQKAMVPILDDCEATCPFIELAGFDSTADCYRQNGYCSLEAMDYAVILASVFGAGDHEYRGVLKAVIASESGCARKIVDKIAAEIERKIHLAATGIDFDQNLADTKALAIAKIFHQDQLTDEDLSDSAAIIAYIQQIYDTAIAWKKEELAGLAFGTDHLVFGWLRHRTYDTAPFNMLLGYLPSSFLLFAREHGLPFHANFYYPDYPTIPVDFAHLSATSEGAFQYKKSTEGDLAGWFGDLCQFYQDWRRSGQADGYNFCLTTLASVTIQSSFTFVDALQDADGLPIGLNMAKGTSLVQEFERILVNGGYKTRFANFFSQRFGQTKADASKEACNLLTDGWKNPAAAFVRLRIEVLNPAPSDLPEAELRGFCDGFAEVFGKLAGIP